MTPKGILAAAGLTVLLAPVPPVFAEPVPGTDLHSIEIAGTPEGLQAAAGVGGEISSRAELFLDAIERLHFLSGPTAQAEQYAGAVTAFLNAWRRARRRDGTVSIEAVQENSEARDRLEELLEIAGFLLLRDSGRYFVRPDPDRGAAARRETLSAAGFRVAGLDTRMNAGEAVVFEPVSFEIPSPIPAEVWRSVVFEDPEPGERLGFRLLTDRDAAFLYYGLLSMTPETVQFLVENPKLLREFYRRDAVGIAAYGRSLVVEDGRGRGAGRSRRGGALAPGDPGAPRQAGRFLQGGPPLRRRRVPVPLRRHRFPRRAAPAFRAQPVAIGAAPTLELLAALRRHCGARDLRPRPALAPGIPRAHAVALPDPDR